MSLTSACVTWTEGPDVAVLAGRDRKGGRVYTVEVNGALVDEAEVMVREFRALYVDATRDEA